VGGGADYGLGALFGFFGVGESCGIIHEDSGSDEDGFGAELHYQRGVGGGGDASGGKIGDGELAGFGDQFDQLVRSLQVFGAGVKLGFAEDGENFHVLNNLADVSYGVDDVSGAGLAFGANHGRTFGDAAESFSEIARTADEWDFEGLLIDVVRFVGGSQDFGFIDIVDPKLFENLGFGEMSDAAFGHDGDGDGGHDLADFFGRGHAGDSAFGADLRRHTLERHDGDGAGFLGDDGLLGGGDVHNDAAF